MSEVNKKSGDFSGLAAAYSEASPDYSMNVMRAMSALIEISRGDMRIADVGAGTGIWTRMLATLEPRSLVAVEPNDDMLHQGRIDSHNLDIQWSSGSAEATGLETSSVDWLTMASSFHWADFEKATREFCRVIRPGGWFSALWNPRKIEANPMFVRIEEELTRLHPNLKRVSSGRSGITESLGSLLAESPLFDDVVYMESTHTIDMSPARYAQAWRSVNDVQAQLGAARFSEFMTFVEQTVADQAVVRATYLTRAWSARTVQ